MYLVLETIFSVYSCRPRNMRSYSWNCYRWSTTEPEHVSGAGAAIRSPTYFCNPRSTLRSGSATSRSTLRSATSFFCNARSPLRSAPLHPICGSLRSDNKVKVQNYSGRARHRQLKAGPMTLCPANFNSAMPWAVPCNVNAFLLKTETGKIV